MFWSFDRLVGWYKYHGLAGTFVHPGRDRHASTYPNQLLILAVQLLVMHCGSNPNTFVPCPGGLTREAASRPSQQRRQQAAPIIHTFEIDTRYFHCQERRFFYPYSNYEIVQIQTTDRKASMLSDTFYILNFPIDHLGEHLIKLATQFNLRRIALCNPLSSEVFLNNYNDILERTLNILQHVTVVSLAKIILCVDILNLELFHTLRNQSRLREVEILPPSPTSLNGFAHIRDVLNRGYALADLLPQVEFFKIPLEIAHSFPATVNFLTQIPWRLHISRVEYTVFYTFLPSSWGFGP